MVVVVVVVVGWNFRVSDLARQVSSAGLGVRMSFDIKLVLYIAMGDGGSGGGAEPSGREKAARHQHFVQPAVSSY